MKNIKLFENFDRVNETGEWNRYMNWEKVKGMSADEIENDEQANWIAALEAQLSMLQNEGVDLEIIDIKGYDMYQGPFATVEIKGKQGTFNIWTAEHDELFIEDWPNGNTDRGFVGTPEEIINELK